MQYINTQEKESMIQYKTLTHDKLWAFKIYIIMKKWLVNC